MYWSPPGHAEQPTPAGFFPVEVVGEAENGPQAVDLVWALRPDVVVMDLQPNTVSVPGPSPNGWAAIQMIKSMCPGIRIVVLTMYATNRASVLAAGADAFLLKGCSTRDLLDAMTPRPADGFA
jgi:DNA-binding NarL/FixJ family response regulator